jgi:hypothetical protein
LGRGIGLAIASFAPVYSALSSGGFFSVRLVLRIWVRVLSISDGIITAANKFNSSTAI